MIESVLGTELVPPIMRQSCQSEAVSPIIDPEQKTSFESGMAILTHTQQSLAHTLEPLRIFVP